MKPWLTDQWCILSGAFVAAMEEVIEVYHHPHDLKRPVVCIDEQPIPLIGETRTSISAKPGQPKRFDYKYKRNGTANLFRVFAPLVGWRHIEVTERRTAKDFAFLRCVVDEMYAEAQKVVLVTDNLNVHGVGSLYEAFDPATARRLAERIEWRYTPKHGSWRNVAECEFAILTRQCLNRRNPNHRRGAATGRGVGEGTERAPDRSLVVVHHRQCSCQTTPLVPVHSIVADH